MTNEAKIVIYKDEKKDDFSGIKRKTITVDKKFPFLHKNPFWKLASFFCYRVIMAPFAAIYCKLKFNVKLVNKEALKEYRKSGYILYGNHTLMDGDAFIPTLVNFPKRTYVVVHPDNISVKGLKNFIQMIGAIPVPTELDGYRGFLYSLEKRLLQGNAIMIYPEAHVWPYYTGIREFDKTSFAYPVKYDVPAFCTTVTYSKKRQSKRPQVTVYIDGPFFRDKSLNEAGQKNKLRNEIHTKMSERAELSSYSYIKYQKDGETE